MSESQEILLEIRDRLARVETKMDGMQDAKEKAYSAYNLAHKNAEDIKEIKDNNKWLKRTVLGLIAGLVIQWFTWKQGIK